MVIHALAMSKLDYCIALHGVALEDDSEIANGAEYCSQSALGKAMFPLRTSSIAGTAVASNNFPVQIQGANYYL